MTSERRSLNDVIKSRKLRHFKQSSKRKSYLAMRNTRICEEVVLHVRLLKRIMI